MPRVIELDRRRESRIAACIQQARVQHQLPGLAVAITYQGEEILAAGCGHFDPSGRRAIGARTPFGVASLSKLVTTLLIMILNDQGRLSLDDQLSSYFPSLEVAQTSPIKLRHLLSHSAGFPGMPGRFHARNVVNSNDQSAGVSAGDDNRTMATPGTESDARSIVTPLELVELINGLGIRLLAPPTELLNYSNEGFCLLGGVVEQIMRRPFAALVPEMIFAPLQMTQSFVGKEGLPPAQNIALPLLREGAGYRQEEFWQAPLFYPAGGIVSSARDVTRLIGALSDTSDLLTADSKRQLMQARMTVPSRPAAGIGYGFGLEYQKIDSGTTMFWHSGQRVGISSFMAWLAEEQLAVSVLSNVTGAPVTAVGHEIIGEFLERTDITWPPASLMSERTDRVDPLLIGRYGADEGINVTVEHPDGKLVLKTSSTSSPSVLRFCSPDSGIVGDQTFRFLRNGVESPPRALALDLRILPRQ